MAVWSGRYHTVMNARERRPSDLTNLQWDNIGHLFPQGDGTTGRPRTYPVREVVNAALYLARGGCTWRMLPHDFPPRKTVSYDFYTWRDAGVGAGAQCPPVRDPNMRRKGTGPERRDHRFPIGEDHRGGRPQGVRPGQEGVGAQAARTGGHARADLGAGGTPHTSQL
ncbi:Uncharacterized protein OS=Gluconobacter oxydans H24 GN=B932_0775 PE=4 SV=1: DUF4096 [Gemmata massiliana]|uniref:Insertion element IS402-like domain-containing protein n=1 Tax=Gemmata massiliana TaxID=1210884 RepID=A0A6P2D2R7_9BACT|nr:Uncharacterized protein OS=Gluconobacter oxydans H24 GN=B932_0775 PE=4 SV=1: DUF4096 [Gemmata massiliana]